MSLNPFLVALSFSALHDEAWSSNFKGEIIIERSNCKTYIYALFIAAQRIIYAYNAKNNRWKWLKILKWESQFKSSTIL